MWSCDCLIGKRTDKIDKYDLIHFDFNAFIKTLDSMYSTYVNVFIKLYE